MPRSARRDRRAACLLLGAALSALLPLAAPAQPLPIAAESDLDRLAGLVVAYGEASRVRWVVAGGRPAERAAVLDGLAERLGPGHGDLLERVTASEEVASLRALAPAGEPAGGAPLTARIAVAEAPPSPCSWRVTVTDPSAPSGGAAAQIPIEHGDHLPTGPGATFEVGFAGPLQSSLYAFSETTPGALRDLAAAPEIAIPVDGDDETLVLVRARRPVPFLDGLRTALADAPGVRADLGRDAALAERLRNGGRGIGANIQLVDPSMIVAANDTVEPDPAGIAPAPGTESAVPMARAEDLVETCLYRLSRL